MWARHKVRLTKIPVELAMTGCDQEENGRYLHADSGPAVHRGLHQRHYLLDGVV
jgi:hypothetical protein